MLAGALALPLALAGCGGGGSGPGPARTTGSYLSTAGAARVAVTVDPNGRLTVFAQDAGQLAAAGGAQGNAASGGQFSAQSGDATVQVSGTLTGATASGVVRKAGQVVLTFAADRVAPASATASDLRGSYAGSSGPDSVYLSVDDTSHATLWATVGAKVGGGLVNVAADGTLRSDSGDTVARLVRNGSAYSLAISTLAGQAASATIPLNAVARARWTVLVFLNAANDLQEFAALNVNQMEQVGSTKDVNIVVQWKQAACANCGNPPWTGTRRYYVTKDSNTGAVSSALIQNLGANVDMGSWQVLRDFVAWGQQNYPAEHYAIVIWNHGAGWRPTRAGRDRLPASFPRSVSIDEQTRNEIQIWQLPQALNVTPKLDMVVFDASLMQMTEVGYEIRNSASLMVGSEESPPGEGYVYNTFLADLAANPTMSAPAFARAIVDRTLEAYGPGGNNTQSAVDLSRMGALATALDRFAGALQAHLSDSRAVMVSARRTAESYAYPDNKDLWDYASIVAAGTPSTDLRSAAAAVQSSVEAAVLVEKHGSLNAGSHGLAIYVPEPASYLSSYANLALARATDWDGWLQSQPPAP